MVMMVVLWKHLQLGQDDFRSSKTKMFSNNPDTLFKVKEIH